MCVCVCVCVCYFMDQISSWDSNTQADDQPVRFMPSSSGVIVTIECGK